MATVKRKGVLDSFKSTTRIVKMGTRLLLASYFERRFDADNNVDTGGIIRLDGLNVVGDSKSSGFNFGSTPIKSFKAILTNLPSDLDDHVFIDIGSGKGRTLILASEYNFKRVIGVEFATDLHTIAVSNIRSYQSTTQKCEQIEAVCVNALSYELPQEKCVLYFFCPFEAEIFTRVFKNIIKSYVDNEREIYVVVVDETSSSVKIPFSLLEDVGFTARFRDKAVPFDFGAYAPLKYSVYEAPTCRELE